MAVSKKAYIGGPVKQLPKFGELGYKFLVEASIIDVSPDNDDNYPYHVCVELHSEYGNSSCYTWCSKDELASLVSKGDPKFKKDYITQQLKDAKALVASLEKQLAAN